MTEPLAEPNYEALIKDPEAHLRAIFGLVHAMQQWHGRHEEIAKEARDYQPRNEHEMGQVLDTFYNEMYADLAYSHALVCTIAAFFESLFKDHLPEVGKDYQGTINDLHVRWARFGVDPATFWDPRERRHRGQGIADSICEIIDAANLTGLFGEELLQLLPALFSYRNNTIHEGYEWDIRSRESFARRIEERNWGHWFGTATSGDKPWNFTLTPEFSRACLSNCERSWVVLLGLVYHQWDFYEVKFGAKPDWV